MSLRRLVTTTAMTVGLIAVSAGAAGAAGPATVDGSGVPATTRPGVIQPLVGGGYSISTVGPNLVLEVNDRVVDVANWSTASRGRVHMWDYRVSGNVQNQRWNFNLNTAGYYQIVNRNSNLCLDKSMDNGNVNGALVYQYGCSGAVNQQWYIDNGGAGGWQRLRSRADGRCLDIRDLVNANDATVQVWGCNSTGWNQAWQVVAE